MHPWLDTRFCCAAGMREAHEGEVAFHDVDSSVLRAFLEFLYGCSITAKVG